MQEVQVIWPKGDELLPTLTNEYVDVHGILETSRKLAFPDAWLLRHEANAPPSSHLLLNGIHGCGKSLAAATLVKQAADRCKHPIPAIVVDCSEDTREYHLKGGMVAQPDGSMAFMAGPFPSAIHLANEYGCCALIVEEIATLTPAAQKMLNPMTDWRKGIFVSQTGRYYRLKPGCRVVVIATMNPSTEYVASSELNRDLRSRFAERMVPLPNVNQETAILETLRPNVGAKRIEDATKFSEMLRSKATGYKLSTRDLVHFLDAVDKLEGDTATALRYVVAKFEETDRALIVDLAEAVYAIDLS